MVYIVISSLLILGKSEKSEIEQVFNQEEAHTMFRIVEFYDDFVMSQCNNDGAIEDLYIDFIEERMRKAFLENDMSYFMPSEEEEINFYNTLDSVSFSQIFLVHDSTEAYSTSTREHNTVEQPYHLSFNRDGKFYVFLERMSLKSEGLKKIYDEYERANSYMFSIYDVLRNPYSIDFSSKDDRLVFATGWLKVNSLIYLD